MMCSRITDRGLEALAKCCSSLGRIDISHCLSITDSGICYLLQNCRKLSSLNIEFCMSITGNGFLGCPQTLTYLEAGGCKLKPEGIKAIVSSGGLEGLDLSIPLKFAIVRQEYITTEAVITISKGCPLLKKLWLEDCEEVELEGWEAIGRNCTNLELLSAGGCRKLCDLGLQALCNGCNKLSRLYIGRVHDCSRSAVNLFKSRKPDVMIF
ncbi:hypothetical protein MKX01_013104 [Papaver californicum]|nr:hypothetical protein MKX01_013104 [Papaver californicum]